MKGPLLGDGERLFNVREHHVSGAQAALCEVPGGRGKVDDAAVLCGIGPLDERVGHHVLREPGARTGDGGVAVADEDEVRIELDEKLERGLAAVVGVGAVGDVFERIYSMCTFQTGKRYSCDLSASYNIGARYFLREYEKSISATRWRCIAAKVPSCAKRITRTLDTLIRVNAELRSM